MDSAVRVRELRVLWGLETTETRRMVAGLGAIWGRGRLAGNLGMYLAGDASHLVTGTGRRGTRATPAGRRLLRMQPEDLFYGNLDGMPAEVDVYKTPNTAVNTVDHIAAFVQDSWTPTRQRSTSAPFRPLRRGLGGPVDRPAARRHLGGGDGGGPLRTELGERRAAGGRRVRRDRAGGTVVKAFAGRSSSGTRAYDRHDENPVRQAAARFVFDELNGPGRRRDRDRRSPPHELVRSPRGIRSPSARPLRRRRGDLGNRSARRLGDGGVAPPHRAAATRWWAAASCRFPPFSWNLNQPRLPCPSSPAASPAPRSPARSRRAIAEGTARSPGALALPSSHPLAVDWPRAAGKAFSGRSCRPSEGPEACIIVAHDARNRRGAVAAARARPRRRPGPGDDTWGDVPYEDRVCRLSRHAGRHGLDRDFSAGCRRLKQPLRLGPGAPSAASRTTGRLPPWPPCEHPRR